MKRENIDPDEFLEFVHDINLEILKPNIELSKIIKNLPGDKFIFTNGSKKHAENVLKQLEMSEIFDDIFDIVDCNFIPKPRIEPYKKLVKKHKIDPNACVLIEDIARNLKPAYEIGMKTIWIENDEPWAAKFSDSNFVNYKTKNLTKLLKKINLLKS